MSVLQLLLFGVALFLGNRLYKSSRWVCVGVAMVWVVGEVGLFGVLWGCWLVGVCDVYPCLSLYSWVGVRWVYRVLCCQFVFVLLARL